MKNHRMFMGQVLAALERQWDKLAESTVTEHLRSHLLCQLLAQANNQQCPCCKQIDRSVRVRRLNTEYVEDSNNYLYSCLACYDETFEHYADMWQDYYGAVM